MNASELYTTFSGYGDDFLINFCAFLRRGLDADTVRAVRVIAGYVPDLRAKITYNSIPVWRPFADGVALLVKSQQFWLEGVTPEEFEKTKRRAEYAYAFGRYNTTGAEIPSDMVHHYFVEFCTDCIYKAARAVALGEHVTGAERKRRAMCRACDI